MHGLLIKLSRRPACTSLCPPCPASQIEFLRKKYLFRQRGSGHGVTGDVYTVLLSAAL